MSLEWMAIRGSGVIAYLLLTAAVVWGLLISTKTLGPKRAKQLMGFHESLSIGALLATAVHMVALVTDEFVDFTIVDVLVPGAADWEPVAAALGVVAFHTLLIVTASFYVKQRIGQARWRSLHYAAFGAFLAAMLHGITAGTDTGEPLVFAMYVASGALVLFLIVVRIMQAAAPAGRPRPRAASGSSEASAEPQAPATVS